jgi:hypothetical protein
VDWPLFRRIRFFAGVGLLCAAGAIGVELLFADIPNGLAFNRFSPSGTSPLWPGIRFLALWISASGLAIAVLLPILRWRYGGYLLGVLVVSLAIPAKLIASRHLTAHAAPLWQDIVIFIAIAAMGASTADGMRASALGQPTVEPRLPEQPG